MPCVPKFSVEALLIAQAAAIVIWLVKVVVVLPALATADSPHAVATANTSARTRRPWIFDI